MLMNVLKEVITVTKHVVIQLAHSSAHVIQDIHLIVMEKLAMVYKGMDL